MSAARNTFGARMRDARERAGISLESVADATKIKLSLLRALERNDVSQWPKGIFRRAFVRAYAAAIALPSEDVLAEFSRLFPEDKELADPDMAPQPSELRLTLADESGPWAKLASMRPLAAVLDLCLVCLAGAIVAMFASEKVWAVSGLVGLVYYPLTAACFGQTFCSRWLCAGSRGGSARRRPQDLRSSPGHQLQIVFRRTDTSPQMTPHEHVSTDAAAQNTRLGAR